MKSTIMTSTIMTSFCPLSAGVGRTGTFLAVDALLENGRKTGQVNVFEYVRKMRECRMNMVQTEVGQTMRAVLACGQCQRVGSVSVWAGSVSVWAVLACGQC